MSSSRIARQIKTSLNTQHYPIRSIPRPKLCRRCMSIAAQPPRIAQFSARREPQWPRGGSARSPARLLSTENLKAGWCTDIEAASAKLISAVKLKVDEYRAAMANTSTDLSPEEHAARAKIFKEVGPLVEAWDSYLNLRKAIIDMRPHFSDPDPTLRDMFRAEYDQLSEELDNLLTNLLPNLILPPLPTSPLPAIVSLNAGVGGAESCLFLTDLAKMYIRFAEKRQWMVETVTAAEGPNKTGFREMTIKFEAGPDHGGSGGQNVYGAMKWERGVHRVQRVSPTDSQGRMHTSTVGVVVLPVLPDTPDAPLWDKKDIREDVMRAGGKGGQHVNKTESAVRVIHIPTGITVTMQDTRSQHQNRAFAYDVLRARLSERRHAEEQEKRKQSRLSQVRGGDRSEKSRTYNYPQDRITDHRVDFTLPSLQNTLIAGDGLELIHAELDRDLNEQRLEAILQGEDDLDE